MYKGYLYNLNIGTIVCSWGGGARMPRVHWKSRLAGPGSAGTRYHELGALAWLGGRLFHATNVNRSGQASAFGYTSRSQD